MHDRPQPTPRAILPALACVWLLGALPAPPVAADAADAADAGVAEAALPEGEWHQFRGPDRSGRSAETGLLRGWPEGGPPVLWERELGEGFSGVSVSGNRLYTLFAAGETEYLGCFRTGDGEELWRLELGEKFHEQFGNGPRSTPTLDGDTVFALSARGRLLAADATTGEVRWRIELQDRYPIREPQVLLALTPTGPGPQLPVFGYAGSPLVVDDLLVVEAGAGGGRSFIALDKSTGEEVWTALDSEVGYSSPTLMHLGGRRQVIVLAAEEIVSLDDATGKVLWRHPWAATNTQPLFVPPDRIFVSTANDVGAMLIRVRVTGDGFETEELWRTRRLKNAWNSSIVLDGHVYGFDNSTLRCVSIESGELIWAQRGLGQGTLIFADGRALLLSDRGKLFVAELAPEGYQELGSMQVLDGGRTWTQPTLADGVLYLRNHEELVAVDLRARER